MTLEVNMLRILFEAEGNADEVYRRAERRAKCSRQDFEAGVRGAIAYVKARVLGS